MSKESIYPKITKDILQKKEDMDPESMKAWNNFSEVIFREGALPIKTKELIAIASGHITQCPYCIKTHTIRALKSGATKEEIMEAIWVAIEMRAGAAFAHSSIAVDTINQFEERKH